MRPAHFMIGAAGHTDHGKTSLLGMLTGKNTQTLKEEIDRGVSIRSAFVHMKLPDGRLVGVIDTPGHGDYLKNFLAGASSMHFALLVVAADDGVMPQTMEHLKILDSLGCKRGMVVVTKADLVDAELLEMACGEAADACADTFLEGAQVCALSTTTGKGFPEFWKTFCREVEKMEDLERDGPFRMSAQRVFSLRGSGTVVTGVPVSGRVKRGDEVVIHPSGARAKVRGLQVYGRDADVACSGHSAALNLTGVKRDELFRGDVFAEPGAFEAMEYVTMRIDSDPFGVVLANHSDLFVHSGAARVRGKANFLFSEYLSPGESTLAQVKLEKPSVFAPGDPLVLMDFSTGSIFGATALSADPFRIKKDTAKVAEILAVEEALGDVGKTIECTLAHRARPVELKNFVLNSGISFKQARKKAAELSDVGEGFTLTSRNVIYNEGMIERLASRVENYIEQLRHRRPEKMLLPIAVLEERTGAEKWFLEKALHLLVMKKACRLSGGMVLLTDTDGSFETDEGCRLLESEIKSRRFFGMRENRVQDLSGARKELVDYLVYSGRVARVLGPRGEAVFFHTCIFDDVWKVVEEICREEGYLKFVTLKERLDIPFTPAVALVHYFRGEKRLKQVGEKDYLVRKYDACS